MPPRASRFSLRERALRAQGGEMPHLEGERTFTLTQFGIAALDRNIPSGIQEAIMREIFDSGPITSTEIISEFTNADPLVLKKIMDDGIQRDWIVVVVQS